MDPLIAIGLVSGVLTFVSFGTAVVKGAVKIHQSSGGTLEEIRTSEEAADELRRLAARLRTPHDPKLTREDRDLCVLADECRSAADKLIRMLEDLKPDNTESKRQSLWASVRTKLHEKDRKDLEEKLKDLRSRLQTQLMFITSRQASSSIQELAELIQANTAKFNDFQQFIRQLEQGVEIAGLRESAKSQIQALLSLPDDVTSIIAQHRVLNALSFADMHGRHDSIEQAHAQTFRWLMHPSVADEEATAEKLWWLKYEDALALVKKREEAHRRFTDWLESGNDIFHISGKLGSGKSTLMKYLGGEAEGSRYLQIWAGGRKLVFAQFYFWRHGTEPHQRSLAGLRRALLHDILQQCPELIPAVLPSYWESIKSMPHQVSPLSTDIKQDDITEAFTLLVDNIGSDKYRDHCFCFFIDGLDEYEETAMNDYTRMAELLNEWVVNSSSSKGIKICVSSRDYNPFLNAFREKSRLHIHELTHIDMEVVVRDGLKQISNSRGFDGLVDEILQMAEGIFQWVIVVVKHLRHQIENGLDDAEELRMGVQKLPTGIYELYREVLRLLPDTARAYRSLEMVSQANELDMSFSVDAYSFFPKYESDNGFIMRDSFPGDGVSDNRERRELGKKLLRGCSGGLLEAFPSDTFKYFKGSLSKRKAVRFTHRSVADFLKIEDVQKEKMKHLREFDPLDAISQMFLADLRMLSSNDSGWSIQTAMFLSQLLPLRYKAGLDIEPYTFLEALDITFGDDQALCTNWHKDRLFYRRVRVVIPTRGLSTIVQVCWSPNGRSETGRNPSVTLVRPIYLSIWTGPPQYPLWKMRKDPSVTDNVDKVALLAHILFYRRRVKSWQDEEIDFAILDILHEKNFLLEPTHLAPARPRHALHGKEMDEMGRERGWLTPHLTVWQYFLQFEWKFQRGGLPPILGDYYGLLADDELDARFAKTVAWFLKHGADPAFAARTSISRTVKKESQLQESILSVSFYFKGRTADGNETEIVVNDTLEIEDGKTYRRELVDTPSLREWILDLKVNNKTKQEILELLPATSWYETVSRRWRAIRNGLSHIPDDLVRVQLPVLAFLPLVVLFILCHSVGFTSFV